ncbi:Glutamine amidotransferase-like protein [Lasiodiplodia theobromae]|uniref:Glutamine amidotransferase-like protein n=1 Tax=Lasiodiplodia theobromae TaxID=45133 RepID=UPI0015C2F1B3|nr:Glutamine amidotransferase-like protein [Lasiodiplodia theobromae]KAF4540004.1 Glutamine amidotransferase-like protein [Lasiodiplodia theobromae]
MATPQIINIALLDADIPVPSVLSVRGLYSNIFRELLEAALIRLAKANLINSSPPPKVHFSAYDIVRGEYPSDPSSLSGIVISGAAGSAYDTDPWISTLHSWLRHVHANHPHVKLFGSCFGHQVICSALVPPPSSPAAGPAVVTKNPAGWELGIHAITLSPAFLRAFPVDVLALPSAPAFADRRDAKLKLQLVHSDHVNLPTGLPADDNDDAVFASIGWTPRCAVQGVYDGDRVLTLQGHFEFDRFVNTETVKVFGAKWEEGALREAIRMIEEGEGGKDDAAWAAEMVMAFFMGLGRERVVLGAGGAMVEGGLLTPPEEVEM